MLHDIRKNKGFTLIELMLVMVIAAVMASLKMQDDKLEMTQLQSKKLGADELFSFNLGVQKYLSDIAGQVPAPSAYPKFYTGVDWLKSDACTTTPAPANPTPHYVPCSFLESSGGKTTMGAMSFATTIDYDSSSGYSARTVLSQMAGTTGSESNSGVLGMAALVASGSLAGVDGGASSGGSVVYCPDLSPMPSGMAALCGPLRDQIVMTVNANGNADQWLRVDHGNMMKNAIEFGTTAGATPASDMDLQAVHPSLRQIRNVARIYNLGASGSENLYIGSKNGASASGMATLLSNAVIIDADQEVLGELIVQGNINATGDISSDANIDAVNNVAAGNDVTAGNNVIAGNQLRARNSIVSTNGNASINGWIRAQNGDITADSGDIVSSSGNIIASSGNLYATSGSVRSQSFVDSNDTSYYANPSATSNLNAVNVRGRLNSLGTTYISLRGTVGASCSPNGSLARTSAGQLLSCVSGRWSGGGGKLVASSPFSLGTSGTNTSGRPMMVYARGYAPHTSPHSVIVMRVSLRVCGTLVGYGSMAPRSNWYSSYDTASGIVPDGCSWSVNVSSTASSESTTVYGQYLYIQ